MSARLASYLGRRAADAPLTAGEMEQLKRDYWRSEAGICMRLDDIPDPWVREGMAQLMRKRFGLRTAKG